MKKIVDTTLAVKDELAMKLINANIPPEYALKVSTIMTQDQMHALVEREYGKRDASFITGGLKKVGEGKKLFS